MSEIEFSALLQATWQTIYMVFIASALSVLFGFAIGVWLFFSKNNNRKPDLVIHHSVGSVVNAIRSIPFIILLISILPLTRLLVGTTIGINAAIVPLTVAAIPFFARLTESAFCEVPSTLIETAHALGANQKQILSKILVPESLPSLIRALALTVIGLIGYSAMAGAIGGGGLGELAINYGYQRFNPWVTLETVAVLVLLVQLIQMGGDYLAKHRSIKPLIIFTLLLTAGCLFYQLAPWLDQSKKVVRVGVITGWSEEVLKAAAKVADEKYQLKIVTVAFSDYGLPNRALQDGSIDANIFQHVPYLEIQNKAYGYALTAVAKTFVYPMGFYAKNIKNIADLKQGALVALPNDPSNEARAILLLAKAGLIKIEKQAGANASLKSIIANPKQLRFKLLDAAQIPRALADVDLAAITNDYLSATHLTLSQALIKEGSDSLYANIIVVRDQDMKKTEIQQLVEAMHSKSVIDATLKIFPDGAAIPAWQANK